MESAMQSIEREYSVPKPHHRQDHVMDVQDHVMDVRVLLAAARAIPAKLVKLAAIVQKREMAWSLLVPTDPSDEEWVIRLGSVEVVADKLEVVLDLAIAELESAS